MDAIRDELKDLWVQAVSVEHDRSRDVAALGWRRARHYFVQYNAKTILMRERGTERQGGMHLKMSHLTVRCSSARPADSGAAHGAVGVSNGSRVTFSVSQIRCQVWETSNAAAVVD